MIQDSLFIKLNPGDKQRKQDLTNRQHSTGGGQEGKAGEETDQKHMWATGKTKAFPNESPVFVREF